MSYRPAGSLHQLLAMERNPLTSVLVLSLSFSAGRVRFGSASFLSTSLVFSLWRGSGFFFLVVRCQNVVNGPRERERTPFPSPRFGPGPGCYNVTMEEEILPCSRIYTYCDITGMPCAGACWEMKWFSSNLLFFGSSLFTLSGSTRAQFDSIDTKMFLLSISTQTCILHFYYY